MLNSHEISGLNFHELTEQVCAGTVTADRAADETIGRATLGIIARNKGIVSHNVSRSSMRRTLVAYFEQQAARGLGTSEAPATESTP